MWIVQVAARNTNTNATKPQVHTLKQHLTMQLFVKQLLLLT